MVNFMSKAAIVSVVFAGVFYQFFLQDLIYETLGYGRNILSITDFNHIKCQKIDDPGLEGCEDMWFHDRTGLLYMACSDTYTRTQWLPALDLLNTSRRALTDRMAVLDTRSSGPIASRLKWLSLENFSGNNGDGTLNLHGLDIVDDAHTNTLQILLVNHRPPIDPVTEELLDATIVGANSTVEHFNTKAGSDTMSHVRTYADELIQTPNKVAWVNDDSFVYTNDHSVKIGFRRHLDPFLGGGKVGYCNSKGCNIATTSLMMPNGLVKGHDGLVYVPSTKNGAVEVFSLGKDHILTKLDSVKAPYGIDNLSVDKNGDIYAACFPQIYKLAGHFKNPFELTAPASIYRIKKVGAVAKGVEEYGKGYQVDLVMEDDGTVLPVATVAVHDAETGRVFLGGVMSPYITVCETR